MKRKTWKKEGRALAGLLGLLVSLSVCVWGLWTPLPVLAGDAEKETGQAKETEEEEIQGADEREIQEEILSRFDFDEIDASLKELFPEERLEFRSVLEDVLSGDLTLTAELFNQLIADQFTYAVRTGKDQLVHMLMIALIAAVFSNFSKVFQSRQLSEISFYALYLLMIALALNTFPVVRYWVESGIVRRTSFMGLFCPLYFAAVAVAKGSVTAVAFYQLVLFLIYLVELLISSILLPAIHIYMLVRVLNDLSLEGYLTKFAELIELCVSWSLKTLLACVVGINVIQGMISPAIDSVKRSILTRGAEAIPGVGDALGGMAEVAVGTAVLVKNGIGMTGALICVSLCLVPLIQVACVALLYKLAAAVIQPVSDPRITGCVETVGEGVRLLMRVVFTTGVLFLLTVAVVSAVTSST
ncbi:stage III sporulation protein AE [Merdimonas faecis]